MKKFTILLLAVVLVFALLVIPANASQGAVDLSVEWSTTQAKAGDKVSFTVSVKNPSLLLIEGIQIEFKIPDELEEGNSQFFGRDTFPNASQAEYDKTAHQLNIVDTTGSKASTIKLVTITCTVKSDAALGNKTLTISKKDIGLGVGTKYDAIVKDNGVSIYHTVHDYKGAVVTDTATCMKAGTKSTPCQTPGCGYVDEQPSEKKAHVWGDVEWDFNDEDMSKSTATITCPGVNGAKEHTAAATVTATIKSTDATCTEEGKTTWNVVAQFGADGDNKKFETTHDVTAQALGHKWGEPSYEWDTKDPSKATLTVTCENENCEYHTKPYTETVTATETDRQDATCENDGHIDYTATFTVADQPEKGFSTTNHVDKPATGHKWPAMANDSVKWTGDAGKQTIVGSVTVKCENKNCDSPDGIELEFKYDYTKDNATCTDEGEITATATATNVPGMTYTFEDTAKTPALGHDYPNTKDDLEITWADDYSTATAKRVCSRDATHVEEIKVNTTNEEVSAATYLKGSVTRYSATFMSEESKALDITVEKEVEADDKLEPTFGGTVEGLPDVTSSVDMVALQETVASATTATLEGNPPSWLPSDIKDAILDVGASDKSGMTVSMKVVVTSLSQQLPAIEGADVKDAYDIHIDMTVEGGGLADPVTAQVKTAPEEITFTIKLPNEGGPIWYVMTNHGGTWAKIEGSKVENGNIVFSSKQFSDFAIISSNDLKDAKIEAIPAQTYTGKAITPKVKVTINGGQVLEEGKDYTVTYTKNTDKGTATVTIEAVEGSDYIGSNTATFQIKAAPSGGSGSGSGNGSGSGSPETGDETPLALYAALLTASLAALAAILLVLRKQRQK